MIRRAARGYLEALNKYGDFTGVAEWEEFLSFLAVNFTLGVFLSGVASVTGNGFVELIATLYGIGVLIPGLAVTVRKLHAWEVSGWWVFGAVTAAGVFLAFLG